VVLADQVLRCPAPLPELRPLERASPSRACAKVSAVRSFATSNALAGNRPAVAHLAEREDPNTLTCLIGDAIACKSVEHECWGTTPNIVVSPVRVRVSPF
jgi:hypothetical protein